MHLSSVLLLLGATALAYPTTLYPRIITAEKPSIPDCNSGGIYPEDSVYYTATKTACHQFFNYFAPDSDSWVLKEGHYSWNGSVKTWNGQSQVYQWTVDMKNGKWPGLKLTKQNCTDAFSLISAPISEQQKFTCAIKGKDNFWHQLVLGWQNQIKRTGYATAVFAAKFLYLDV